MSRSTKDNSEKNENSKKTFKSGKADKKRRWQEEAARETNVASSMPRK